MANARILYKNLWDAASLTVASGSPVASLPIENTQIYNNSRVFRASNTNNLDVRFDFPEADYFRGFALWRHNLTGSATIRLRLYANPGLSGGLVYDSGIITADVLKALGDLVWGKDPLGASALSGWDLNAFPLWFDDDVLASSGRLEIVDTANPEGFIEIGRIYCGDVFEPFYNFDLGSEFSWSTDLSQIPTAGGTVHTLEAATYRTISFNLSHLTPGDRTSFVDMSRIVSIHKDFFISLKPDADGALRRDLSFAAKFTQTPTLRSQAGRYETNCSIREV